MQDANATLHSRAESGLESARSTVKENLANNEKLRAAAIEIKKIAKEVRAARLSDSRSFRDAAQVVKDFHGVIEDRMQLAVDFIEARMTENGRKLAADQVPARSSSIVVLANDGEIIATTGSQTSANIPDDLVWDIESIDRDRVDLEALRHFLSDHALLLAARNHLKRFGMPSVAGISYHKVAKV